MITNTMLNTRTRPTVVFNAENPEHRYWAYQFLKHRSWRGCPYLFALPQSEPNVYTMVTRLLTEYYSELEFGGVAKKQRIRAVL